MFQDKIESVGDSLSKSLILKDVFAPIRKLLHDPYALTCELKVCAAYVPILLMIFSILFGDFSRVLVCFKLKLFDFFNLHNPLLQTVCHVIDQAV
jgi:hypothetical protein